MTPRVPQAPPPTGNGASLSVWGGAPDIQELEFVLVERIEDALTVAIA